MLNILLMLLGLISTNGNDATTIDNTTNNVETPANGSGSGVTPGGDTGGQSLPIPPKR